MTKAEELSTAHMLRELESPSKELTRWEENFLESVGETFERTASLTDRQVEILERIYTEKT
jgi:hypothetical protein